MKSEEIDIDFDDILTEWSYRCKKGYPVYGNKDDMEILNEILSELGFSTKFNTTKQLITEADDKGKKKETRISKKQLQNVIDSITSIKDKYSRYLSVFYYFDPNSLGTISEVLLTKLLNAEDGVEAVHTGASGGLTDLVVNGVNITLKTTAAGDAINLGSDEIEVPKGVVGEVAKQLKLLLPKDSKGGTFKKTVAEMVKDGKKANAAIYDNIKKRIESIASKISGPDNDELLVWAEKSYTSGILTQIKLHVRDFRKDDVVNKLLNSRIYITEKAWGIKDDNDKILVAADNSGKMLNIMPAFIYSTSKTEPIVVNLPIPKVDKKFADQVKQDIPVKLFAALDKIHAAIFGK